ncbi:helix-turn-helix domain-containing protein, partial [Amycolatopsis pithecellobii]
EAARHRPYRPRAGRTTPRRERDAAIVKLTRFGLTAREIAQRLGCTRRTVVRGRARHRVVNPCSS